MTKLLKNVQQGRTVAIGIRHHTIQNVQQGPTVAIGIRHHTIQNIK
jgi:hypothetical protein